MFWIIWTYLLITLMFAWQFFENHLPEDDYIISKYGKYTHTLMVVFVASLWPVMLPVAIWDRIYGQDRS